MQQDRVGFGEKTAVFQLDRRHLADRVFSKKFRAPGRPVKRGDRHRPKRYAQVAQQQPNLVAVAGIVLLVERNHPGSSAPPQSIGSPAWVLRESRLVKWLAREGIATSPISSGVQPPCRCTVRNGRIWLLIDNSSA